MWGVKCGGRETKVFFFLGLTSNLVEMAAKRDTRDISYHLVPSYQPGRSWYIVRRDSEYRGAAI